MHVSFPQKHVKSPWQLFTSNLNVTNLVQEANGKNINWSDMSLDSRKSNSSDDTAPDDNTPADANTNESTNQLTNKQQKEISWAKPGTCLTDSFQCQCIVFWLVAFLLAISGTIATVYIYHNDRVVKDLEYEGNCQHLGSTTLAGLQTDNGTLCNVSLQNIVEYIYIYIYIYIKLK